jgi:outer membrane lipoprotein
MPTKILSLLFLISLLEGCASTPVFDSSEVVKSLTPQSVIAEPVDSRGKTALWGGTILDTRNLKDSTRIEVLAYPLDSSQRPVLGSKPLGRFIIQQQGYLEPATYSQGRLISVIGSVGKSQSGNVGDSAYTYPVLNTEQLHLWSPESGQSRTGFSFGIGIRL